MIKHGFTLIEMLLVMSIISILMLVSVRFSNSFFTPSQLEIYQITSLIEMARFEAIEAGGAALSFERDCIFLEDRCYFENSGLTIQNPQKITFNADGHINRGTHVDLSIGQKKFRLIFNVGEGAYHIEENSFYLTGCIIWLMHLFKRFGAAFWMSGRHFESLKTKRKKHDGTTFYVAGKCGFTLSEALLALLINTIILLSGSSLFSCLSEALLLKNNQDLAFAIIQLTKDVNTALEVENDLKTMTLVYPDQTMTYSLNNHRLVKTPGFDIFLHDVDDIEFQNDGEYMYIILCYRPEATAKIMNLGKKQLR